jgi:hypothetical protein
LLSTSLTRKGASSQKKEYENQRCQFLHLGIPL